MSIEEKAKAYDEALAWMRELYPGLHGATKEDAEHYFPQLRESEDEDERTRKRLIEFISDIKRISESGRRSWAVRKDDVEMCDAFLSYLEKQKELPFVKDVMLGYPGLYFYDGERMHFRGPAMEEKQKEQKELPLMDGNADLYFDEWNQQKQNPTKRQCFEEGMRYAQRLQKEQKPVDPSDDELQRHQDELYNFKVFAAKQAKEHHISFVHDFEWNNFCAEILSYFTLEQKPADEQFPPLEGLDAIKAKYYDDGFKNGFDEGVESVKPAEWSEEDERILTGIIERGSVQLPPCTTALREDQIEWLMNRLKSLRPQPKPAWSENDENNLNTLIQWDGIPLGLRSWVFELPEKVGTRPHWKPSEEQMDALKDVAYGTYQNGDGPALRELYEQLKKLM